jgi:pyridoxal phosphate enzyme (YggS family)
MTATVQREFLRERLALVNERIAAACRRVGRARSDVLLVAVTKTVSADIAALLPELGVTHLGESRPQELWRKAAALSPLPSAIGEGPGVRGASMPAIHWHQIGHLQTNKIERTLPLVRMIHSVDRLPLLHELEKEAVKKNITVEVLLEVNASGETNKHGLAPDQVPEVISQLTAFNRIQVRGLMTMAAFEADPEQCRPTFSLLRDLRDRLAGRASPPHQLHHLSMGMSNDFEVAIEEGATIIRLGTVLFEGIAEAQP